MWFFLTGVLLSLNQRISPAGLAEVKATPEVVRVRRPDCVSVEPGSFADSADARASVSKRDRDRIVCLAWLYEYRYVHLPAAALNRDYVAGADIQLLCGRRTHECRVVPRDLGDRVRSFLKPGHVVEPTV